MNSDKRDPLEEAAPCSECDTPREWKKVQGRENFGGRPHVGWTPGPCLNEVCVMYLK